MRADPELHLLADVHVYQPPSMWVRTQPPDHATQYSILSKLSNLSNPKSLHPDCSTKSQAQVLDAKFQTQSPKLSEEQSSDLTARPFDFDLKTPKPHPYPTALAPELQTLNPDSEPIP